MLCFVGWQDDFPASSGHSVATMGGGEHGLLFSFCGTVSVPQTDKTHGGMCWERVIETPPWRAECLHLVGVGGSGDTSAG